MIFSFLACPPLLSTGSRRSNFSFCFRRVYKLKMFPSDTINQKMYLDKDKTECVDKDKAPIPRRGDDPPTQR